MPFADLETASLATEQKNKALEARLEVALVANNELSSKLEAFDA